MYAPDAYVMVHDKSYLVCGTMSNGRISKTFDKTITQATDKMVRIVVTTSNNERQEAPLDTLKLRVTAPDGKVYMSQYQYDNKQVVVIKPAVSGSYNVTLTRLNGTSNELDYAVSYNVITE